ncbi:MAG: M23 family metallopeptidase [Spirochaetia bacterium]|nr:M23 family metallopeptidase [Spirochaetia bacterium]
MVSAQKPRSYIANSSHVIRIRLPQFSRYLGHAIGLFVVSLTILVLFSLFENEAASQEDTITDPKKRALFRDVKDNVQLLVLLESRQREIHTIFQDQPSGIRQFYMDDQAPVQQKPIHRVLSTLRSNADYSGVYSGFFREIPHAWPLKLDALFLNSGYGTRGAVFGVFGSREFHPGVDLRANFGTPVIASADGVVKAAVQSPYGYGNHVILLHSSGYETLYGHLRALSVKTGQEIRAGQLLGYSGSTGASNGPHLHYEIRMKGKVIDPGDFLVF